MGTNDKADKGVTAGVISEFDRFLAKKGLTFQGVVVGAAPLILLDIIDRRTKDCDVLDPMITDEIKRASVEFARRKSEEGHDLPENWFNNGPASLKEILPEGWREIRKCCQSATPGVWSGFQALGTYPVPILPPILPPTSSPF